MKNNCKYEIIIYYWSEEDRAYIAEREGKGDANLFLDTNRIQVGPADTAIFGRNG